MSFGNTFDGYCVIDAPFISTERRDWFEKELKRVGVNYTVVEARRISDDDPRLEYYENGRYNGKARLSLIDATKDCIDVAISKQWRNFVIFQSDIVFRKKFKNMWSDVELDVRKYEWDLLFLYRWAEDLLWEPRTKTALVPIISTVCSHCFAIRKEFYAIFQEALDYCAEKGSGTDIFTFEYLNRYGCRVVATNKNLAGQQSNFKSAIKKNVIRANSLEEMFRIHDERSISNSNILFYRLVRRCLYFLAKLKIGKVL